MNPARIAPSSKFRLPRLSFAGSCRTVTTIATLFRLCCLFLVGTIFCPISFAQESASLPTDAPAVEALPPDPIPADTIGYRDALILGVVEGITEYLPISSTGHLILTNKVLGLDAETPLTDEAGNPILDGDGNVYTLKAAADAYAIIIQLGAILAVVVLYWRRVTSILVGFLGRDPAGFRLGLNLLVAFLPAAVLGLLFDSLIEEMLFAPGPVAFALAAGAILMFVVEARRRPTPDETAGMDLHQLSFKKCLAVGFLQCVAMWPGTSRSMMTIVGGYLVGLRPARAAEFSFLLGLVTLSAAAGYRILTDGPTMVQALDVGPVLFGCFVAFVAAVLAVRWLVSFLTRRGLSLFGWYRLGLAVLVWYFWSA